MFTHNISQITPDGSARHFYRQKIADKSYIIMQPGQSPGGLAEANSYVQIGNHLANRGIPVPRIYDFDPVTGTITMEDLGDLHLQTIALQYLHNNNWQALTGLYESVLLLLIKMQFEGIVDFQNSWCFDTPSYDAGFAFKREALYFIENFACDLVGVSPKLRAALVTELQEFCALLNQVMEPICLLHRDFQSRNILWANDTPYIIDFQGARIGPPFYDLASLLFDPYIPLPDAFIMKLLDFYIQATTSTSTYIHLSSKDIYNAFRIYGIIRLIQAIAAYSFLWRKQGKTHFRNYIAPATNRLLSILTIHKIHLDNLSIVLQNGLNIVTT